MKMTTLWAVVMMAGAGAWAKPLADGSAPVVTVCMESNGDFAILTAKIRASQIFEQIPVRIAWKSARGCNQPDAIRISLSPQTEKTLMPGALAYAKPYQGTCIELFYDRIRSAVSADVLPALLAHVLVHEITHILEGVSRHSETGIMKACWTPDDYRQMAGHPLPFAAMDILLIRNSLKTRRQWLETLALASGTGPSQLY